MNYSDLDKQIIEILSRIKYLEQRELHSRLKGAPSEIGWEIVEARIDTLAAIGHISKIELYDIQLNTRRFVTLSQNKKEVWEELIDKGYRTKSLSTRAFYQGSKWLY